MEKSNTLRFQGSHSVRIVSLGGFRVGITETCEEFHANTDMFRSHERISDLRTDKKNLCFKSIMTVRLL